MGNIKTILFQKIQGLKDHEDRQVILISLIIISLPFSVAINSIFIVIFFINSLVDARKSINTCAPNYQQLLISTPFFLSLLALVYTSNFKEGVYILEKSLSLLIFPLAFLFSTHFSQKSINKILATFIYTVVIIAVICFINSFWLVISNDSWIDQSKLLDRKYYYLTYSYLSSGVSMNPIYLGMYVNYAVFLVAEKIVEGSFGLRNMVLMLFLIAFLILLSSKINIIIFFIMMIVFFARQIKRTRSFSLVYISLIAVISLIALFFIPSIKERIVDTNHFSYDITQGHIGFWNSTSLRLAIWDCTKSVIIDNWLFGVGTGAEKEALLASYEENGFAIGLLTKYNTHNLFLQFAVRFGVVATILTVGTNFIWPLIVGYKNNHKLAVFMIIIILASLVEVILVRQKGIIFYSLFLTLFLNQPKLK